jgi:integrase
MDFKKVKLSETLGQDVGTNHTRRSLYSALWQADGKKIRRFAPVDFIGRYMDGFFDYAIADEVHELKGGDTAQGNALGTLAAAWWYRFRFGGRIVHESAKTLSKTVAHEDERQRRRGLEESWNHISKRRLPPLFEKAATEWLAIQEGRVAINTVSAAKTSLKHMREAFGSRLLCDITAKNVAEYQQKRLREKAQGKTINLELGVFRQIMKAHECWLLLEGKVKSLPVRKGVGRCLTPDDEQKLLTDCAKADSATYTATVLALNTAMRKDEVRKLQWCQLDLFEGLLTVGNSKTQAGTGRVNPMNGAAVRALADWGSKFPNRKPEHFVFPWCESRHIDPTRPTNGWRTAWRTVTRAVKCPKCGQVQRPTDSCRNPECKADMRAVKNPLAKLRFHDLRHTAITKLSDGQASDQTIMSIAGHVSRQMLEHYSHIRLAAKRTALDSIATPLPTPTSGKPSPLQGDVHQNGNQNGMTQKRATGRLLN